ncbi:MAG: MBL fold metallo-hydrolase [Methylophilaceae bacterium]|nr:MBL fold metallo-hydrolase [Methyloradius sp.]
MSIQLNKLFSASVIALSLATLTVGGGSVYAASPMVKTQAPGYYRTMLGSYELTAISDGTIDVPADKLLSEDASATVYTLHKAYQEVPVETSVNTYLINTGSKLILFDTGAGTLFGPTLGKFVDNLKAAGYDPSQIDEVYLSHLHPDHSGGLALNGKAVFPTATIYVNKVEADFWLNLKNKETASDISKSFFEGTNASVQPYIATGRFKTFAANSQIAPGIKVIDASGHTPGHVAFDIKSGKDELVLIGDLIHVPAVQLDHSEVTIAYDVDADKARASRKAFFDSISKEGQLVGASHISFPGLGHLNKPTSTTYQWVPVIYQRMK